MIDTDQHSSSAGDIEIDLSVLVRILWAGKWIISGFAFVSTAVSISVALMLPNVYRAEALLAPNENGGTSSLSALAAQYSGLANLAGINLRGGSTDKTRFGLEVLQSRKFITDFIERHDLLLALMAVEGWDAKTDKLIIDQDLYDAKAEKWIRDVSYPRRTIPSLQEAYDKFLEGLSVSQDKTSGFVTVAVEYYSPNIAKQWVDLLVDDVNVAIMTQDVNEAEQAIAYLNKQIQSTSLADLQSVFYGLIEEQTKTIMLAKVSNEYVFRTLDPAVAPELKYKPKRSLIVILGMMLGAMVGTLVVLVRRNALARREEANK